MRCEDAQAVLSAARDGEAPVPADVRDHVAGCTTCTAQTARWDAIRDELRAPVETPDLVDAVMGRVDTTPARRRVRVLPLVAAAVAGLVVGSVLVSSRPGRGPDMVAAAIPERVLAAQTGLDSLSARVDVVERGWHPDVPVRRYSGTLDYEAPEKLVLGLTDDTKYPSTQWVPNHVGFMLLEGRWRVSGPAPCPIEAQPGCTPAHRRVRTVHGREPFAEDVGVPLDLVLPAGAFSIGTTATVLDDEQDFDGRSATGVVTTAAQLGPLLDGLRLAGNWRPVPPTARATVWLDREALVPLAVDVLGADDQQLLTIRLSDVRINEPFRLGGSPGAPGIVRNAGFVDGPVSVPMPARLPDGMTPHRSGRVGAVQVASWSDGRAWVKVRATSEWVGGRLFGALGDVVGVERLGGGTAYVAEGGRKIALHTAELDVVVTGSVAPSELRRIAASLGVRGEPVPGTWTEASSATVASAREALPGLLVLPRSQPFAAPAVRVAGESVTLSYSGAGDRGVVVVQAAGTALAPPLDADAVGVSVRGRAGRWTAATGQLEWVERGRIVELHSRSLALAELVELADTLRRSS